MTPTTSSCVHINNQGPLFQKVYNAHKDDIHGISKATKNTFITGSKDSSVKRFGMNGQMISLLSEHPACRENKISYLYWVTALDNFKDGSWVSGQRNSFLQCGDLGGRIHFSKMLNKETKGVCKERNETRICALKCLHNYVGLVGLPGKFFEFDYLEKKKIRSFSLESPDWVYGFCPINRESLGVIHSTSFSIFRPTEESFEKIDEPIFCNQFPASGQKPFISSIQAMKEAPDLESTSKVVLSFFGGETQVLDLETKQPVHQGFEHTKRVWQSIPYTPNTYLSCSDDATIKLWDLRNPPNSHCTLTDHPGRVSSLCLMNEHLLVAGTCADNVRSDPRKAQLYFYDLRRISSDP